MTDVATECAAELAQLPASQHAAEAIRIGVLNEAARTLRAGGGAASRSVLYKSRLLAGTSMGGATPPREPGRQEGTKSRRQV